MSHEHFEAFRQTEAYLWLFAAALDLIILALVIGIPALFRRVLFGVWFWEIW